MLARVGALPVGWSIVRGDARALPFDSSSFEIVAAAYLLHLLSRPDRRTVLGELRRVLRPQGRLVVVTVWPARRAGRALLAGAAPAFLGGLRPHDPRRELESSGFALEQAATKRGGYPSLVVHARRCS
jgi:ubiquinone/menaquinone biosynthesis C-methylase UbiE